MRTAIVFLSLLAASCAHAKPKPAPVVVPVPLPEYADGADAAKVLESRTAMETARLRFLSELEAFERKYRVNNARGEGWDEVGADGKPCVNMLDCRLRLRRIPVDPPKPAK